MQNREDPHVSPDNLKHDPIVADSQFPVAAERATEGCAETCGLSPEPCLDQSADTSTRLGGNLWQVIAANGRVIAKRVLHSAFLDATPPPYLVVRECGRPDQCPFSLLRDLRESQILVGFEGIAQKITRLC